MYKKHIKDKKWRFFQNGGGSFIGNETLEELRAAEKELQEKIALKSQGQIDPNDVNAQAAANGQAIVNQAEQRKVETADMGSAINNFTEGAGSIIAQQKKDNEDEEEASTTEEDNKASKGPFSAQDYIAGAGTALQGLQTANLDGKITGAELSDTGLKTASSMAGPYGQVAEGAITIGENLLGDNLYKGLGEGVEYEKTGSKVGKGALRGAAMGAKIGQSAGPLGAAIGAGVGIIGGGAMGFIGQGKAKRGAMKEFEKRRDERILNYNNQSRGIYADQLQNYYKKGGKAVIKIKEKNKDKFTNHCKSEGYDGVTQECINKGMKSTSQSLRKQAIFANNVRGFNK